MDSDDSASDLFITQSSFRTNVETQEANEAVNFLENSLDLSVELPTGDVVQYLDFTEDHKKEYARIAAENAKDSSTSSTTGVEHDHNNSAAASVPSNVLVGEEPFVPLLPELFDEEDVLPDDVLLAALDASERVSDERHGKPVSSETVKENSTKGYVYLATN